MNPIRRVQTWAECLRVGKPDPQGAALLAHALEVFLQADGDERAGSFERALGVTAARGEPNPVSEFHRENRAQLLAQALEAAGGDVAALHAEVEAYHRVSVAERSRAKPYPGWSEVRRLVHLAAHASPSKMPRTRQGLGYAISTQIRSGIGFTSTDPIMGQQQETVT